MDYFHWIEVHLNDVVGSILFRMEFKLPLVDPCYTIWIRLWSIVFACSFYGSSILPKLFACFSWWPMYDWSIWTTMNRTVVGMVKCPSSTWPASVSDIWLALCCLCWSATWNIHRFVYEIFIIVFSSRSDSVLMLHIVDKSLLLLVQMVNSFENCCFSFHMAMNLFWLDNHEGSPSSSTTIDSCDQLFIIFGSYFGTCPSIYA